ncbi:MAG: LysR family transcriptional regulator, partial [Verrucomicrobiota bacterium]|nr:LysR family transcriptional regulator [Verrucomicrobiota bacterium]
MRVETLKIFCDLVEIGSVTEAARLNGLTHSAVSQQISALECRFKPLFLNRSKRNFCLTREGQV